MISKHFNKNYRIIILVLLISLLFFFQSIVNHFIYLELLNYFPLLISIVWVAGLCFSKKKSHDKFLRPRISSVFFKIIIAQVIFCVIVLTLSYLSLPIFFPNQNAQTYAHLYLSASIPSYLYGAGHPWSFIFLLLLMATAIPRQYATKVSRICSYASGISFSATLSSAIDLQCLTTNFLIIFIFLSIYILYFFNATSQVLGWNFSLNIMDCLILFLFYQVIGIRVLLKMTKAQQYLGWSIVGVLLLGVGGILLIHPLGLIIQQKLNFYFLSSIHYIGSDPFRFWLIYYWMITLLSSVSLFIYLQALSSAVDRRVFLGMCACFPLLLFFVLSLICFGVKIYNFIIRPRLVELEHLITLLFKAPYYHWLVNLGLGLFLMTWINSKQLNINLYRFAPNVSEKQARRLRQVFIKLSFLLPCCLGLLVSSKSFGLNIVLYFVAMATVLVFIVLPSCSLAYGWMMVILRNLSVRQH